MIDALSNFRDVVTAPVCIRDHRLMPNQVNQGGHSHG